MIAQTAQQFMEQEILPQCERLEDQDLDLTVELLRKAAAELDLLAIDVPEKYEGLGLDKPSSTIVAEKLSRVGSFAISYGAHCGIGTLPVVYFGTEEQKQQYLPKLAKGELLAAYALGQLGKILLFRFDGELRGSGPPNGESPCQPGRGVCCGKQPGADCRPLPSRYWSRRVTGGLWGWPGY